MLWARWSWFFLLISNSHCLFSKPLGTVPSTPNTIGITITLIFHSFFFSSFWQVIYWNSKTQKMTGFFFFFLINAESTDWDFVIHLYHIIISIFVSFSHSHQVVVFHWSLSDKQQISSGLQDSSQSHSSPLGWGCRIHQLQLCRVVRPHHHHQTSVLDIDIKQSDGKAPVMLELWGMQNIPALFKSGQWHFHQDNAPVQNSILVTDYLTKMGIKTVLHPPSCPDLGPCDFWLFLNLRGYRYETIEEMKEAVTKVIDMLTQRDFRGAFQKLLEWYNKCIAAGGDYFKRD